MRWVRWALGGAAILAVLALTAMFVVGGLQAHECDDSATSPSFSFVGPAIARQDHALTYRVDDVLDARFFHGLAATPVVGDEVAVRYLDGDERFVHVGQRYQVDAFGIDGELASNVANAGECAQGGTVHADGTAIDTGLFTRDGIEPYVRPGLLVLLVGGAAVGAAIAVHQRRHPRLTIDGRARR